ncbi:MAG: hypothetical protein ACTS3R_13290 [Inquilinaceae bacterium]
MSLIRIGEIADWLHPRSSRHKALVLLYAYFDETGIHDGAHVTALSGFVGSKSAWEAIENRWAAVLAEFSMKGVSTFHMTDCVRQEGEFSRVDTPQRGYIITQLSEALGAQNLQAVSSAVVVDDWSLAVSDSEFLRRFPKPFDLCFDDVVRQLWEWGAKNAIGETIAPMFAHQPEYHGRMEIVEKAYSAEEWYRRILGPIAFGYPDQVMPLQCADLLVHQMGWSIEKTRFGKISLADSGQTVALENATGGRFVHGHWFDADALALTVSRFRETGEIYSLEPPNRASPE